MRDTSALMDSSTILIQASDFLSVITLQNYVFMKCDKFPGLCQKKIPCNRQRIFSENF